MNADTEPIIGRDQLVGSEVEKVGENILVTLTGPEGVPKTRLALEVALSVTRPSWIVGAIHE